jgi:hypothetical protein
MALSTMYGFRLSDGSQVQAFKVGDEVEFVTRNADGEVISTVRHRGVAANKVLRALRMADSLTAYFG